MKHIDVELVSRNLKACRIRAGYTQAEASKKIGKSDRMVQIYEANPKVMSIEVMLSLANLYGCSPQDFFVG